MAGVDISPGSPGVGQELTYGLMAFWLHALIYGAYLSLFMSSFPGLLKNWGNSRVFFVGVCVMFLVTTMDACVRAYTLVEAYGRPLTKEGETTLDILHHYNRWYIFMKSLNVNVIIWITDFMVIYRCYIVWGKSWKVILFPSVLLASSFAKNTVNLHFFLHPESRSILWPAVRVFLEMCYPLSLAQNLLTTGLIAYKILRQHHDSRISRLWVPGGISLIEITRIIIESALLYTLQMFVLCILFAMRHRAMVIFQSTLTPSASLIFVLMAVRVDIAKARDYGPDRASAIRFPTLQQEVLASHSATPTEGSPRKRKPELA